MPNLNKNYIKEKEGDRTDVITLKMTIRQEIDYLVETEIHNIEVEEDSIGNIHKIIGGSLKIILGVTIEETIIENKDIKIEVEVETIAGILIDRVLGMTIHEVGALVETGVGQDNPAPNLEGKTEGIEIGKYQDQNYDLGLGQVHKQAPIKTESGVINARNMVILLVIALSHS